MLPDSRRSAAGITRMLACHKETKPNGRKPKSKPRPEDHQGYCESRLETQVHQRRYRRGRGGFLGELSISQLERSRADGGRDRAADHVDRQWQAEASRRDEARDSGVDAALQTGAHRPQAGMRPRGVWSLHRPDRRCSPLFLLDAHPYGPQPAGSDD